MFYAVRFTRKTAIQELQVYALLLIALSSAALAGCSGLVTANNVGGGSPTPLTISSVQAATPTTSGFQVSWSTNVAANSVVDYGTTANYGSSTATNSAMVTSHQVALTSLTAGTLYHFRARSTDTSSSSASSPDMTFSTATTVPSITSLNPTSGPVGTSVTIVGTNFGATQGASTVTFNGTATTAASWGAASITATVPSGATTGNVVVTVGGAASNGVSFTVQADIIPPTVPAGLTATAISSSQINLSWTASTDNVGVTGYNVYRGGTKIGTAPGTTYQDAGLSASTSYTYNVSAFDAAGNTSAQSAGASAITQASGGGGGIPTTLGWYQIPNTTGPACPSGFTGCANVVAAWSGGIADTTRNRLILWGGGHTDYNGNEVYALDLNTLTFARLNNPSTPAGSCVAANPDGTPNSRHTYGGLAYLPSTDQMFAFNGSLACGTGSGPNPSDSWTFSFPTLSWNQISYAGNPPGTFGGTHFDYLTFGDNADYDPNSGLVFAKDGGGLFSYNPATKVWTSLNTTGSDYHLSSTIDTKRKLFFEIGNGQAWKVNISPGGSYAQTSLAMANCGAMLSQSSPGLAYDPVQDRVLGWGGGDTVYLYNPDTDSCTSVTYPNGPGAAQQNGTFGRFRYFPNLGVFALVNNWASNAYTLRLTPVSGGGTTGPNISGISVNSITTVSANVIWTTDVPATTQVEYGLTTGYGTLTTLNSTLSTSHSQALTGLTVGTVYHYRVHSKNSSGVESISGDAIFSTNSTSDTTPPTVSMTAPASGATISGTVTVSATATDNVGVASVQFTLDGANLGAADTAAPYQIAWDTTTATNGAHTLSAAAVDTSNNTGTAGAITVTVSNSGNTALQDFQARCATPGVIVCEGFDRAAEFVPSQGPQSTVSGLYSNDVCCQIVQDTTTYASGGGALKFPIKANDGSNGSSVRSDNWLQLFCQSTPPNSSCTRQVFGPHTTFYVQFRYRIDDNFANTDWENCCGSSPKTADFASFNSSCGQTELTTNMRGGVPNPMMYTNCGSGNYGGIYSLPGTTQAAQTSPPYSWQNGYYNCSYPNTPSGTGGCFTVPANKWMTYYYAIQLGGNGTFDSQITAWIGVEGQPLQIIHQVTNFPLSFDTPGYDAIWFNVYMTGFTSSSVNPAANAWLDEVIVCTAPIPAPAANGGGIPQ